MSESLFIAGFALAIAGIGLLNPVGAMIVAGVVLMIGSVLIERSK